MNYIGKVISITVNKIRTITIAIFGPNDSNSAPESAPYGVDCSPIKGMQAIYLNTSKNGQPAIIGYINTNQLAAPGEFRMYATNADGAEKVKIWGHNDGTVEIAGTSDAVNPNHATQWEGMNTQMQSYITDLNASITAGVASAGGTYTPPVTPLDLTAAKIDKILVP
jgi:hypothetical protein